MSRELLRMILTPALLLGGFSLFGVIMLSGVNHQTLPVIEQNERAALLAQLTNVVDEGSYDNDLLADRIEMPGTGFGSHKPVMVYRARQQGQPVAAVFVTATPRGYSGTIQLVVGVRADKTLSGVRVVRHSETPGLGDKMELRISPWVLAFDDRSLGNPALNGWAVKKDGGDFDQFTGATITPRAVVQAVRDVLLWVADDEQFSMLFNTPAMAGEKVDNG